MARSRLSKYVKVLAHADLFQDGWNCGGEVATILENILKDGVHMEGSMVARPDLPCAYTNRQQMLSNLVEMLLKSFQFWGRHRNDDVGSKWERPEVYSETALDCFLEGIKSAEVVREVRREITRRENSCQCQEHGRPGARSRVDVTQATSRMDTPANEDPVTPGREVQHQNQQSAKTAVDVMALMGESEDEGGEEWEEVVRKIRRAAWHGETLELPQGVMRKERLKINEKFDDYASAPTVEENMEVLQHIRNIPIFNRTRPEPKSLFEHWRDSGRRIDSHSFLSLNMKKPWRAVEHYLPTGKQPGSDEIDVETLRSWDLGRGGDMRTARADLRVLGMEAMLNIAGEKGSNASTRLFLSGVYVNMPASGEETLVHVSLEKEAVVPENIHVSLDIDSLVWITPEVYTKLGVKILMGPRYRAEAPISKSNHLTVNILPPPTDSERANKEWPLAERVPLSRIPHIAFGQFGEGAGSGNIIVCFPRMMHKHPENNLWATMLPAEIQDVWFSRILQPAMTRVAELGTKEYVNWKPSEWKLMARHHRGNPETREIGAHQLESLLKIIREMIQEAPENDKVKPFGSLFFVVEIRGFKAITKATSRIHGDVLEATYKEVPTLDWERMEEDRHSECWLDLGMSITPLPENGEPLVGLWRLSHVMASYATAGTNKPNVHYATTLSDYGGLQAEFPVDRAAATHHKFRSTYNLYYEVSRYWHVFCQNRDAHLGNGHYLEMVKDYSERFENAKERTYGVRDETRMSVQAVKEILPEAKKRVSVS
jgi:hypothetical protein